MAREWFGDAFVDHYNNRRYHESLGNLTPSEAPRDIYSVVLERVLALVRADAAAGVEHATRWLQLSPDRTLAKPVVMTIPYSATRQAVVNFCHGWAQDRAQEVLGRDNWCFKRGAMSSHHYMATILYRETSALIAPAKAAMSWFKKVGKTAGKLGLALRWTPAPGMDLAATWARRIGNNPNRQQRHDLGGRPGQCRPRRH